jgi:hypothetical protein
MLGYQVMGSLLFFVICKMDIVFILETFRQSRDQMIIAYASYSGSPGLIPGWVMLGLWWTK